MNSLTKRLLWILAGMFSFAVFTGTLAFSVSYKPFGVPESRRAEYEQAIERLEERKELVKQLDETAKPVASFESRSHDFGMINPHTTANHSFPVMNKGDDPLTLEVAATSCKCTVGDLKKNILMPGESTVVTMTWNTGYQADEYEQTATVLTNDPLRKEVTLKVKGVVRAELVTPERFGFLKEELGGKPRAHVSIYSQLWDTFTIKEVHSDLPDFEWTAEPMSLASAALADREPKSAWRIDMTTIAQQYGRFDGEIEVVIQPGNGGKEITRKITCDGHVRAPISFVNSQIDPKAGLDIGTLVSGKEHKFPMVVRLHGDKSRKIEVLDVQPPELEVTMRPTEKEGSYRLELVVPKDCPMVTFNLNSKRGYVEVGDPDDESFSNWFPVYGAVVELNE